MPGGRGTHTARVFGRLAAQETARSVRSRASREDRSVTAEAFREHRAKALRAALEDLGPLYTKVGQILSTRPDLVPQYVMDELALLTDRATAAPFPAFEQTLEEEFGARWRSRFRSVRTERPLGTASLAQVYRAELADGTPCVVKIQRPGAHRLVVTDMAVLGRVAKLIGRAAPRFTEVVDVGAMLETLFRAMEDELDFTREADNVRHGRRLAREFRAVRVPKVVDATERVMIQALVDGEAIHRVKPDDFTGKQRRRMARELISFMFRGYFVERFFHADPHPGNILLTSDGKAHLIDWGMVGRLDRSTSLALLGCFTAMARNDGPALAQSWIRMGATTPWSNTAGFTGDLARFIPTVHDASLERLNFGVSLTAVLRYSTRRGIQTSPVVSVVGKSVANIEGSIRNIYPKLKLADAIRDALTDIMTDLALDMVSREQLAQYALHLLAAEQIPGQAQRAIADITARQATVQTHTDLGGRMRARSPRDGGLPTMAAAAVLAAAWYAHNRRTGPLGRV